LALQMSIGATPPKVLQMLTAETRPLSSIAARCKYAIDDRDASAATAGARAQ
jgi:hypothetical protein